MLIFTFKLLIKKIDFPFSSYLIYITFRDPWKMWASKFFLQNSFLRENFVANFSRILFLWKVLFTFDKPSATYFSICRRFKKSFLIGLSMRALFLTVSCFGSPSISRFNEIAIFRSRRALSNWARALKVSTNQKSGWIFARPMRRLKISDQWETFPSSLASSFSRTISRSLFPSGEKLKSG